MKELHDSVSTARQPHAKPHRTGHTNLQKSLQVNLSRSQQHFSDEIINNTDIEPPQTIQRSTNVLAWQYVHGNFDYNKMILAPMGCAVQIYQSSERRTSWGANAIDGWYLQTSPEHYQCHVIYVKQTKSERMSDTVFFKTKYITQPTLTQTNIISKALNNLTHVLKGKSNQKGLEQIEALTKLDNILNNVLQTAPPQSKQAATSNL